MNQIRPLLCFGVALTVSATALSALGQTTVVSGEAVPGNAEIYGAGNAGLPGSSGLPPVEINVPANATVLTFILVDGKISVNGGINYNDPDGVGADTTTSSTTAYGGLSGFAGPGAGMLTGVFTTASGPSGTAPATLDFTQIGTSFTSLAPLAYQVFFIGDGLTGDGTGTMQQFVVPAGATKLYLGITDASGYHGAPGAYYDDQGAYSVTLAFTTAAGAGSFITYTNTTDTNWFNPGNWSPNQVPGAADTAVIRAGTVGITDSTSVGTLYLGGGALNAPFGLTINSGGTWGGGGMTGIVKIGPAANMTFGSGGGTLNLPGITLVNDGTITWTGGTIQGGNSSEIYNNGTFLVSGVGNEYSVNGVSEEYNATYGGSAAFNNAGSFIVQNSPGQTALFASVILTNTAGAAAPMDVPSGTLSLGGGGYLNGAMQAEMGGFLQLDQTPGSGASYVTGPNFQCGGRGEVELWDLGVITLTANQGGLDLAGGTVYLAPTFENNGAITNLTLDGADLPGTNVVTGTMTWLGGEIDGVFTVSSTGVLNLGGSEDLNLDAALTNSGQIIWNGSGGLELDNDGFSVFGSIENLGVFDAECDSAINQSDNAWFNNAGLFEKLASTNETSVQITFTNTGTVRVHSGDLDFNSYPNDVFAGTFQADNGATLSFSSGGVLSGSFNSGFGADIDFDSGAFTQTATATFSGTGTIQLDGYDATYTFPDLPNPLLQLNQGTINLPVGFQGGFITNLTLTGVTLNGTNVVTGVLNLQGDISGPLVIAPGGVVNCGGPAVSSEINAGVTILPGGTLNIIGTDSISINGITNQGTINWTGGYFSLTQGSGFYNQPGAVFNIECDDELADSTGRETFVNGGLIQKSVTTNTTAIEVNFNNTGVVVAQSGTLNFDASYYYYLLTENFGGSFLAATGATIELGTFSVGTMTLTGNFTSAAGGTIELEYGTFTPGPGLVFNGPGSNYLNGEATIILTNSTIPNLQFISGTVLLTPGFQGGAITNLTLNGASLAGTNLLAGTLTLNGALNGPLTVASNAVVNLGGGIGAPLTLLPGATLNWVNTNIYDELYLDAPLTIPANAVVNLSGNSENYFYFYTPLTNAGTVNWGGGTIYLYNSISNEAGASFNLLTNISGSGGGTFNNAGVVRQYPIAGTSSLSWYFNNTGLVDVQSGTLDLGNSIQNSNQGGSYLAEAGATLNFGGGGYLTGEFTAQGGATINLTEGIFTNTTSTVFDGVGTYNLNGGTFDVLYDIPSNLQLVSGAIDPGPNFQGGTIANLNLNGLSIAGPNTNTVTGELTVQGNVQGPLVVAGNATLNLNGEILGAIVLQPGATFNWAGNGNYANAPITVAAGALWNIMETNGVSLSYPITNSGTINWSGGNLYLYNYNYPSDDGSIFNLTGATFNIMSDGQIYNPYSDAFIENDGLLRKQGTSGSNYIAVNITNTGTIDVESGLMNFAGAFEQTGGTWNFGITSAGAYGALDFAGLAPLPNTINVATNGGYFPQLNNTFTLARFPNSSGTIGTANLPVDGAAWQLNTLATSLTLAASAVAVPAVSITGPTNTQIFAAPATLPISATATETGVAISSVQLYAGPALLATLTSAPYNYSWNSPDAGAYTLGAVATDVNGGVATSAPINITILTAGPQTVTYTWNGGSSSDWFTAANWTPNGVPGALDNVILNNNTVVALSHNTAVNNVLMNSGTLGGTGALTVTNSFTWIAGNITNGLVISNNATLTFNSAGTLGLSGATLVNQGTVLWTRGAISGNAQTIITNAAGALWLMETDNTISLGPVIPPVDGLFVNNGIIRKITTTGNSGFASQNFVNNGTLDAESGTIALSGVETLSGTYHAAAGAVIRFGSGSFTLAAQPEFTGTGTFLLSGGTLTMLNDIAPSLQLEGGNIVLGPNFQNGGAITNLTLKGASLLGTNTVTGTLDCQTATIAGGPFTVAATGLLVLGTSNSYNSVSLVPTAFVNLGEVLWAGGYVYTGNTTFVTNNNLWLIEGGYYMSGGTFVNNNLIRQIASSGADIDNVPFINNGTVDVEEGSLSLYGGGTFAGAYNAEAGATINFSGGTNTLTGLPNFTGLGNFEFNGGYLVMTNDIDPQLQLTGGDVILGPAFQNGGAIANLTLAGALLTGTNTVTGTLTVTGGGITGSLTISTNGTAVFNPGFFYLYANSVLTNNGSVFCTGNEEYFYPEGASNTIVNNGLWLDQGSSGFQYGGTTLFLNNGIYRKEGSDFSSYIDMPFDNNGLVDVRTGGLYLENGGVLGGTFNTLQGDYLQFTGGSFNFAAPPANFTGPGTVGAESGATVVLTNDVIASLPLSGGLVVIGPTFQNNGIITNLSMSGGSLTGTNVVSGSLNLGSGATVNGKLTILTNAVLTLSGTGTKTFLANARLVNQGVVDWTGGPIVTDQGAVITNSGLWLTECDSTLELDYYNYGTGPTNTRFYNLGTFTKTTTTGATAFQGIAFLNSGTLDTESGLNDFSAVNADDTNTVAYAQTGATLVFGVSAPNLAGGLALGTNVSLDGTLQVNALNGYTPQLGDEISLMTYGVGSHTAFANLVLPPLTGGVWDLEAGDSGVNLRAVASVAAISHSSIAGTVVDANNNPISGVTVYATEMGTTNLVQNGSFEMPYYSNSYANYALFGYGSTNITGWTVAGQATNDNVAIAYNGYDGFAEDGSQYFDPTGNTGGGAITQTFPTVAGATYELVFYHASYSYYSINQALGVAIGTNYYTFGETESGDPLDWTREAVLFTAPGSQTTLTFYELTGFNADDNFIDNVKVIPPGDGSVLQATTDASGNYQITAPNGTYAVGVSGLPNAGYNNVPEQSTAVNGNNPPVNFTTTALAAGQFFTVTTAVSPPALGSASGGGSGFQLGNPVTVSVTQNANPLPYYFAGWTENGVLESTNINYAFTAYRNRILVADFALPGLAIVASNSPSPDGVVSGAGVYTYNSTNVLTAFPFAGYDFVNWTENGVVVSTSNPLTNVVLTNLAFVANYTDANPAHTVTIASLPAGLTTGTGAGTYTNGQTAILSAPASVPGPVGSGSFYIFQGFTLNGSPVTSSTTFSKSFTTFDAPSLTYAADYQLLPLVPQVVNASDNYPNPVPPTTGFLITFQFDRSMRSSPAPLVVLTNLAPGALQATVGINGRWSSTIFSNDTYETPGITFGNGMDGNVAVYISRVQDIYGHALTPPTNVLNLVVHSTPPPPPVVTVTSPANGSVVQGNTTFAVRGTVSSTNAITSINIYANSILIGTVPSPSSGAFSVNINNGLAGGSYSLQVVALDASGLTGSSASAHLTVNPPGTTLIDFEALNASAGPVSGAALSNYLAGFGVKSSNITAGTSLAVVSDTNFLGGNAVQAASGDNFLVQTGAGGAVSYTLVFSQPYVSVSWVRPTLLAGNTGASLPAWQAHIFDNHGNELGSTGESALGSFTNIPAANFTLLGASTANIASIRFDGNNQGASDLSTLPLDNLALSTIPVNTTLSVALSSSVGTTAPAPASITLTASTSDSVGTVTQVSFYSGGNLLETATPGPAAAPGALSVTLDNLAPGSYTFTAVAQDSVGASSSSAPLNVTVTPVTGLKVINFDALNTAAGSVTGAALSNYLSTNFGVTLSNVTVGTAMEAAMGGLVTATGGAEASSAPNYFTQAGLNQPVSFTLVFHTPLQAFGFTRVELLAGAGGVSHPQWQATALDSQGVALASAGEGLIMSAVNVPARSFVLTGLNGDGIAAVRFDSDSQHIAAFSAVLLDDLVLNANAITPQLSVSLSTSAPPTGVSAGTSVTLSATVTDSLGGNDTVNFFSGSSLIGTVTSSPYNYAWNNLLPGSYALRAQVVDSTGVTSFSTPVTLQVNASGNSQLANFDSLNTAHGATVSGTTLSNYLRGFGITVSGNLTPGAVLTVVNQANLGGGEVAASSPPNVVTLTGVTGPVSYTVDFASLLAGFSFTRPELLANPFVSHPAWQAVAYDAEGVAVAQVGEGLIASSTNVGAQAFTLSGPGIASVQFSSQGSGLSTFNAMVADDFVLTGPAAGVSFPPAVAITSPVNGLQVAAPVTLNVTASAEASAGVAAVSFYANGSAIGTATAAPYAAQLAPPGAGGYTLTAVAVDNNGLMRTSPPVNVTVLPPAFVFGISSQPTGLTAEAGSSVTFSVGTTGTGTVTYQWFFLAPGASQPSPLLGQTASTLTIFPVTTATAGQYTVQVTSGTQTLTSSVAELEIAQPPTITLQPVSQTAQIGANVTLLIQAGGTGPFNWQWLLNGTAIAGATNSTYSILAAQPLNSGSYQVIVGNSAAFVQSQPAQVTVQSGSAVFQTTGGFANSVSINPLLGPVFGNNANAAAEAGGPSYNGAANTGPFKPIWFNWTASFTGVISLTTEGSDFDTTLGIFTGTNLTRLTRVASDDDSGGFFTSLATFNVTSGTTYQIMVDGFNGASGNVVLGMPSGTGYRVLNPSSGISVPVIATNGQPTNELVQAGQNVTLKVIATSSTPLTYQWYFQGSPVGVGGTGSTLTIPDFQSGSVGLYYVLVANSVGSVESQTASVQIAAPNQPGSGGPSQDKFGDSVDLAGGTNSMPASARQPTVGGGDSRGYSVSQVFSTVGATKEVGEPNHCGQSGGASQWFIYTAPTNGTLDVNTSGSSYNTIVAIYTNNGPTVAFSNLVAVGCGFVTNFQTQGQPNVVLPGVLKGTRYFIAIDGYQGASGMVNLHIGLGTAPSLVTPPANQFAVAGSNATFHVTAVGSTNFNYQWQLNGVNVAKATNSSLTISNAQLAAIGSYTVIVSNVVGVVTSTPPATLTLQTNPVITVEPTNVVVLLGKPASFDVTIVGVNTKSNPLVLQWYSTNANGVAPVAKATNALLTFPTTQYSNNGSFFIIVSNNYGAATSTVATLTVQDLTAPTVTITAPANKFSTNGSSVTVRGTASDPHVPITSVQVQVNGGPPTTALGTNTWTNLVTLVPGTNLVVATSTDLAGNISKPVTNHFIYLASSLFTLQTNGFGRLTSTTGASNGATLIIGRNYTVTAIRTSNYLFQSWSSGPSQGLLTNRTDGSNLTFLMYTNLILQANFVTNPFLAVAGTYSGLFYPTNAADITQASSGYLSATISSNSTGTFTAKILLNGGSNAFSGTFDLTGTAHTNITRTGKPVLDVTLNLNTNPADALLTGSVSNANSGLNAPIYAGLAVFNPNSNPATNYAGRFTLALPPGPGAPVSSPDGFGYIALTNSLGGASVMGGALADGTPFTWSAPIEQYGNIPLYLSLYSGGGSVMGWIYITNEPPQDIGTNSWVTWIKPAVARTLYPAGFTNLILTGIAGSPFTNTTLEGVPVLNLADGTLTLSNGNLAGGTLVFTNIGTNLTSRGSLTNLGGTTTNHLAIAIATNTGIVTVTFQATGEKTNTIAHGVVIQNQTNAVGAFPGTTETGSFILH